MSIKILASFLEFGSWLLVFSPMRWGCLVNTSPSLLQRKKCSFLFLVEYLLSSYIFDD